MATGNQKLAFAIRAVNEAQAVLKDFDRDLGGIEDSGKKAQRGSENAADGMSKANKEAEKGPGLLKGFASGLGDIAKIAGGFVLGQGLLKLPGFFGSAAKGAAEDAASTARLELAVRNAGYAFEDAGSIYDEVIRKGQDLAFSDDDIRESLVDLLAATGDVTEAEKRHAAALDLARGAGIPLEQATRMLGKINEENVEVFTRLGITLGEGATEMDALAAVQEKFGGQAELYGDSLPAKWEKFNIRIGEAKEAIGAALLPAMESAAAFTEEHLMPALESFAAKAAPAISSVFVWFQTEGIPAIQRFAEAAKPHLIAIGEFVVTEVLPRLRELGTFIVEEVVPAIGDGIAALKPHFEKLMEYYNSDIKPAMDNIITAAQAVVDWFREHWPEIERVVKPIIDTIAALISGLALTLGNTIAIIVDLIQGDWSGAWGNFKDIVDVNVEVVKTVVTNMITFIRELGGLAWEAAKNVGSNLIDGLVNGIGAIGGLATDIGKAVTNALAGFINSQVIDRINSALEFSFNTHVPGIGTIHIDPPDIGHIPMLAKGGIVTMPTLAMVGEAGQEAVLPIDDFRDVTAQLGQINRTMLEYIVPTAEAMAENAAMLATFYRPAPRNPYSPGYVHVPARSWEQQGDDNTLGEYNALGYGDELARGLAFGAAQVAFQQDPMAWARMTWGLPIGAQLPAWASRIAERPRQVNVVIQGYDDVHDLRRKLDQVGVFA